MNFKVDRSIENNVFKVNIIFDSFGSDDLTMENEEELLKKYGTPLIDVGGKPLEAKLTYTEDKGVKVTDEESAEKLTMVLNSKKIKVDETFVATYAIDANSIRKEDLTDTFDSKLKLAEAKCVLFEHTIRNRINTAMESIKSRVSNFEKGYPITLTK